MSEAAGGNTNLINGPEDVIEPFLTGNKNGKAGIELELTFFKREGGKLVPIGNAENKALQAALNNPSKHGYDFAPVETSEEAATMTLEIKTGAASFNAIETILQDLDRQLAAVEHVCADKNYVICPFGQAPHVSTEELQDLVIARDSKRAEAFITAFREHGLDDYYRNFFLNNAVQTSISYKDPDHLHRNILRLVILAAPLSSAHDNSSGYLEGNKDPQQTGLRLRQNMTTGNRGGCPDFIFTSQNGEDLVRNYFDWVFNTKLIARCDKDGKNLEAVEPGQERSFQELIDEEQGLNNQTNYELALGMLWPHFKLAYIKDDETQEIKGVRYEARACDSGGWRNANFPLIVSALAFDENFGSKVDGLLAEYGFDLDDPASCADLYQNAIDSAINYQDSFGTGKTTDFLARFGTLTKETFALKSHEKERLKSFFNVCASGVLPGVQQRATNSSLNDVLAAISAANDTGTRQGGRTKQKLLSYPAGTR